MSSSHWQRVLVGKLGLQSINILLLLSVLLLNTSGTVQAQRLDADFEAVPSTEGPIFSSYGRPGSGRPEQSDQDNGGNERKRYSDSPFNSSHNPYYQTGCATSGDLVIANGVTCSLAAGSYTYDSITVQTGGTLILLGNTSLNQGVTLTTPLMTVETGGNVNADGKGYPGNTTINGGGPGGGKGPNPTWTGGGGGYGGIGESGDGAGGIAYGSVTLPSQLGSSGGSGRCGLISVCPGGAGGGAIKLVVSGTLVVNGVISANGVSGGGRSGGGSGGSIWIDANTLNGNGTIHANGGVGLDGGGDGAGGRLALYSNNGTFALDPQHVYARGAFTQNSNGGGPGTVYFKNLSDDTDRILVNNGGNTVTTYAVQPAGTFAYDIFDLRGRGTLRIAGSSSTVTLGANALIGDGTGRLIVEGTVIAQETLTLTDTRLTILGNLQGGQSVNLQNTGMLELYATSPLHTGSYTFTDITVGSGATLRLVSSGNGDTIYTNDPGLQLNVANLTIASGGKLLANGTGYPGVADSTRGPGGGAAGGASTGGGGGHGGPGQSAAGAGGTTYDSLSLPLLPGSSGGGGGDIYGGRTPGGSGGGAIWLIVSDLLTVNGEISADGASGGGRSGGGSGGSILIETATLAGNGSIHANGGTGLDGGGSGGAGRIAIYSANSAHTITFTANGGPNHVIAGEGTIYFDSLDLINSTVQITPAELTADGTSLATVTVTVLNVDGYPMANKPVEIAVSSGSGLYINNQSVGANEYVAIGSTNVNGVVTATLKTTRSGTRTIKARSNQELISQQGTVEFLPGAVNANLSSISASPLQVAADGQTPITVTVIARDANSNLITGSIVEVQATGSAVVTQPANPTDNQGRATATVIDTVDENVTITATIDGVDLSNSVMASFKGADLDVLLSAPAQALAGGSIQYTASIHNSNTVPAQNVTLQVELPDGVTYTGTSSSVVPTQDGQTLTWNLGTFSAGASSTIKVYGNISPSLPLGTSLVAEAIVATTTAEENPANNSDTVTTSVVDGYEFTASITPASRTLGMGAPASFDIKVQNTGILTADYDLTVQGLDTSWYSLSNTHIVLAPGEITHVSLDLQVNSCAAAGNNPFTVEIENLADGEIRTLSANLNLQAGPLLSNLSPNAAATLGSRNVNISWRSDVESTSLLTVFPVGEPENALTFNTSTGTAHSAVVPNLDRNQTYEWYVQATSSCGTTTSAHRQFTVGNGIVFVNRSQNITIDRDYDQRVIISVRNDDSAPHTLTTSVNNPFEDLIVNFVGSGSVDETITLQPAETRQVTLAVHAQDAELRNYDLAASLVADEEGTPVRDNAILHLTVLSDGDFTIVEDEAAFDALTLGRTYVITNHGKPITDLSLTATDPVTGEPARIFLQPSLDHVRLETGQSIRVVAYPIFTEDDAQQTSTSGASHLASMTNSASPIDFVLTGTGAGNTVTTSGTTSCPGGKQIFPVQLQNMSCNFETKDWYCTNRPVINTPMRIPAFLSSEAIESATLSMSFAPNTNVLSHSGQINFNGQQVGSFTDAIPTGQYSFDIPKSTWNSGVAGSIVQNIGMNTTHSNNAHYVSATGYQLQVNVANASTYVCAESTSAALQAVLQTYSCLASSVFNWQTDVFPASAYNGGQDKTVTTITGTVETDGTFSNIACTQESCGDPINTKTGSSSFTLVDLTFPTSAGDLIFQRSYSSATVGEYTQPLGFGWTHNHAAGLIFPEDPGGMQDFVLFQGALGNRYLFKIESDGSYTPGPGVIATLTKTASPTTYTLTSSQQGKFIFNEDGRLTSRQDAQGHAFVYDYDAQGRLEKVSADGGSRFIQLAYDSQGRIISASDHANREVAYGYDAAGDLVSTTDVLGQTWTYTYDSGHRMTEVVDPSGRETVRTEYDLQGRAYRQFDGEGNRLALIVYNSDGSTSVYDALGREEEHQYDDHGIVTKTIDPLGRSETSVYGTNFRPDEIRNSAGHTLEMTWSTDGRDLLSKVDPAGNRTEMTYDALGNLLEVVDSRNYPTSYAYDGRLLISKTDALNNTVSYTYTPEGYLESETDLLNRTTTYTYDSHGQRLTTTDPQGNTTRYAYDPLGRLVETTDIRGRVTHNEYNAAGQLLRVTQNYDPNRPQNGDNLYNIVTQYEYDVRGNQVSVTDTYGRTTHYEYDDADRLIRTIDPLGNATVNTYDANGRLISTTDALGRVTRYEYDATGRLIKTINPLGVSSGITTFNVSANTSTVRDAAGHSTTFHYDELGRVIKVVDPLGNFTTTSYDENGNVASRTDQLNRTTRYEYDALNRLVKTFAADGGITETVYDDAGNRIATIGPLNKTTHYMYDDAGRLIAVTDPLNRTTRTEYDTFGRRSATVDAAGERTTYTYDALDRVIAVTSPAGTTHTTYDALGNVIARMDANGHTTQMVYDELNRLHTTTDAKGNITSNTYDEVGNLIAVANPLNETTQYSYDALNRQIAASDPLGNTTRTTYDSLGNVSSAIDANGVVTHYEYDALGRQTAVVLNYRPTVQPDVQTNVRYEFTYNAVGNRIAVMDPNGNITHFEYDSMNRLVGKSDPLTNTWSYTYDLAGSRITMVDPKDETTQYVYDDGGQLINIDYPGIDMDVTFTYSLTGQREQMTDGLGTTGWEHDENNRMTSVTDPFTRTIGYDYDAMGNNTGLTYPDGKSVDYVFDPANLLTDVTDWNNQTTSYTYDAAGRLLEAARPNNVISTYAYDPAGRLTQVQHTAGGETLSTFQYTYDPAGNRIRAVETMKTGQVGPTVKVTVTETSGMPMAGKTVYVFNGDTYTGQSKVTDANGEASITLPAGSYRFRADVDGTQFWSAAENHCIVGQCAGVMISIPQAVLLTVQDSDGSHMEGLNVYAFDGTTYTNFNAATDGSGQAALRLPQGSYRFRADYNGTQFWSGTTNHCEVPGCTIIPMTVPIPVTVTVHDSLDMPKSGLRVYAYAGDTYSTYSAVTDGQGRAVLTLPAGNYRFRVDEGGTQFWSGETNHCAVPGCRESEITVSLPTIVTVKDNDDQPQADVTVYAFDGTTYTNFSSTTDADGRASITLPSGMYRFRADFNGTQFWSGAENHCAIPGCTSAEVIVSQSTVVTVEDTNGLKKAGVEVYAFDGTTYTSFNATTDADGEAAFTLPPGSYRFRADYNNTQFWSGESNHCTVPGCSTATVVVSPSVMVSVQDTDGAPKSGLQVYVFDGATYKNFSATTSAEGQVFFTLPQGSYRFRVDMNGTQFWSGAANHCTVPVCDSVTVTVTKPLTVTVRDTDNTPKPGLKVYAYNGTTYTNFNGTTDSNGQATFTLPQGSYRFRADLNGTQFWSGTANHCDLPGCETAEVITTIPVVVTVQDSSEAPQSGVKVYAFNGPTYTNYNATTNASGEAVLTLPQGSYRFRADFNGSQYWSGATNHCSLPGCTSATVIVSPAATPTSTPTSTPIPTATGTPLPAPTDTPEPTFTPSAIPTETSTPEGSGWINPNRLVLISYSHPRAMIASVRQAGGVTVAIQDTGGAPKTGLNVYAFDGSNYTGYHGTTDAGGQVSLDLPDGSYRFRADFNGTQFWSNAENHCRVPSCNSAAVTVTVPIAVTVRDSDETIMAGLKVYAFNGTTYTNYTSTTDANGQVAFTLPQGDYRFRADYNGTQFWSNENNHCTIPGCESAEIVVTKPITVTVLNSEGVAQSGLKVYAFDGAAYTNFNGTTDANGQASFTLPPGEYRFRADYNGTQFWSGEANHCTLPGCANAAVTVTKPVTVTVAGQTGQPYPGLSVYAFDGVAYTGFHGVTDANGNAIFTLPQGSYRFRADYDGVQFWSSNENDCTLPGCTTINVTLPGGTGETTVTIDYTYDALNRLTSAVYTDSLTNLVKRFEYTYDAAGNVVEFEQDLGLGAVVTTYTYDSANQLVTAQKDSVTTQYTYDTNGSLISDGAKTYTYDFANRLIGVDGADIDTSMAYNGLGQRLTMEALGVTTQYTMNGDQPLSAESGGNTTFYLYGLGAIAEKTDAWSYALADGLNTQRQLTNDEGEVTYAARYTPWGDTLETYGDGGFTFGYFDGLMDAATGLLYVGNGQYYDPETSRFLTREAKPESNNPYAPWDPTGALLGPLGLLAVFFGRRKKVSKWGAWLALLLVVMSVGISLSGCKLPAGDVEVTVTATSGSPVGEGTATFSDGTTVSGTVPVSPNGTPLVVPISCPTPTITVTPIATPTATPTCPICAINENARMFYEAVQKHQYGLPPGFSVALLLAMGAHESGAMAIYNWSNSKPHGGVLQLRKEAGDGRYHPELYKDTPEGYEQNVIDAIAVINEKYDNAVATMNDPGAFHFLYTSDGGYPNNPNEVSAARAMLYYNAGGTDWWKSDNPYSYVNKPENKPYVGKVADKLESYVPENFGFSDPTLVNILRSVQAVVNAHVP